MAMEKDRDHYPGGLLRLRAETPERDEIQIRCREHHLDADQDENRVTAGSARRASRCRTARRRR